MEAGAPVHGARQAQRALRLREAPVEGVVSASLARRRLGRDMSLAAAPARVRLTGLGAGAFRQTVWMAVPLAASVPVAVASRRTAWIPPSGCRCLVDGHVIIVHCIRLQTEFEFCLCDMDAGLTCM